MKIYAGYTDALELEKYAGKDAWVLCEGPEGIVYVRVVAKSDRYPSFAYHYIVNTLDRELEVELLTTNRTVAMGYLTNAYTRDLREFSIVSPLRVLTTNQLYSDYDPDLTEFDKYIGKDVWILAQQYLGYDYYIKPISREGNLLKAKQIPPQYIDRDWVLLEEDYDRWMEYVSEPSRYVVTSVDSWEITKPIEALTTAEIIDSLNDGYTPEEEA